MNAFHPFDDETLAYLTHRLRRKSVTRREVLSLTLGGLGVTALGPLAGRIPIASGASLGNTTYVLINLDGGCDLLNAVIPSSLSNYFSKRPTIGIQNAVSLPLTGGPNTTRYRLHPALDQIHAMWNESDVAIVENVGYPTENLSHFESADIYSYGLRNGTGQLGATAAAGWMARFADRYASTPLGAVSLGLGRPKSLSGGTSQPLQGSTLANFRFAADPSFSGNDKLRKNTIGRVLAGATGAGTLGSVRNAIDQGFQFSTQIQNAVANFSSAAAYTGALLSQHLRDVAILVQGGFETRLFYTGHGGHDTHSDQLAQEAILFQRLDDAIGSFATDMKAMGQWNQTVLCIFTEFGRRNYENASKGTDHGGPYPMLLIGGGVKAGVFGKALENSDLLGEYPKYGVDFRQVHREVLKDHFLVDPAPVFPEAQPISAALGIIP